MKSTLTNTEPCYSERLASNECLKMFSTCNCVDLDVFLTFVNIFRIYCQKIVSVVICSMVGHL